MKHQVSKSSEAAALRALVYRQGLQNEDQLTESDVDSAKAEGTGEGE